MSKPAWEDMSVFFNGDDFAIDAVVATNAGNVTVKGIYDNALYIRDIGEADFEQNKPRFVCDSNVAKDFKRGMAITIDNKISKITDVYSDGTGLTTIYIA